MMVILKEGVVELVDLTTFEVLQLLFCDKNISRLSKDLAKPQY